MRCFKLRSTFRFAAAIVAAAGILGATLPAEAAKSHLNQKSSQHVTLTWVVGTGSTPCALFPNQGFVEIRPDGTVGTTPFVIPERQALHVTDVAWDIAGILVVGEYVELELSVDPTLARPSFQVSEYIDAELSALDFWMGERSMTTGFSVVSGATLCPTMYDPHAGGGSARTLRSLILRGYLMNAQ